MKKEISAAMFNAHFSAKKRAYSSTPVGFPIRDDLSAYLQGISGPFPTWERARLACTYVRVLGICLHRTKKNPLDTILSPDQCAAVNADGARHGLQNSLTAPLFVPAWLMGAPKKHHANTTQTTPCGASNLSERQCNSLLVSLKLAWELLASLLNSYWRNIQLTLANHSRPIQLTLANYSTHIGELFDTKQANPIESNQPNRVKPTQPSQTNPTKPTQPNQPNQTKPTQPNKPKPANPTKPTQPKPANPTKSTRPYWRTMQLTLANHSTHIGKPFNSYWRTIQLILAATMRGSKFFRGTLVVR